MKKLCPATFDKELVKKLGARFVTKYTSFVDLQKFIRDCLSRYTPVSIHADNPVPQFSSTKKLMVVQLVNNAGQLLQTKQLNVGAGSTSLSLDMSNLLKGVYFLTVKGNSINKQITVVKQ